MSTDLRETHAGATEALFDREGTAARGKAGKLNSRLHRSPERSASTPQGRPSPNRRRGRVRHGRVRVVARMGAPVVGHGPPLLAFGRAVRLPIARGARSLRWFTMSLTRRHACLWRARRVVGAAYGLGCRGQGSSCAGAMVVPAVGDEAHGTRLVIRVAPALVALIVATDRQWRIRAEPRTLMPFDVAYPGSGPSGQPWRLHFAERLQTTPTSHPAVLAM